MYLTEIGSEDLNWTGSWQCLMMGFVAMGITFWLQNRFS